MIKRFETQEFDEIEDVDMDFDEIQEELEIDEDEAYVRETGGMSEGEEDGVWIGDEFVGIGDDEELEDFDITEEEL